MDKDKTDESELPSATADAMETYENIQSNIYIGSATGRTIAEESMPCECKYEPGVDDPSAACGDDDFCINRMMFMECMESDCSCGRFCRNRRFQLRQYARVDVIRTVKKGFGLRALTDLPKNSFIMEYIGEVIPNSEFIRRTRAYEAEGLKHYYFMTLKTDEIIDATKKGCLARFINHSCNPNSVTQKWVVGKTMRIGIFTTRFVKAGTELTFDYKFERYGAVAQKCFCEEPNCKGYIGGAIKNEEDSAGTPTVPTSDEDDTDTMEAVTLTQKKMIRKMRRRRASEPIHDPDEVQSFVKKMLDSVGKTHLVNKLLHRLELTNDESSLGKEVFKKFVRLHGLKMLKFWLGEWKNDPEIVLKVLQVLKRLPLANKNGLEDCKMFDIVRRFTTHDQEDIRSLSQTLLDQWDQLKSVYRIPKRVYVEPKVQETDITEENGQTKRYDETDDTDMPAYKRPRFESSREFFDPDDDIYEHLSLYADEIEIRWKLEYPPIAVIPTAPRAMLHAAAYQMYNRYGRPGDVATIPTGPAATQSPYPYQYAPAVSGSTIGDVDPSADARFQYSPMETETSQRAAAYPHLASSSKETTPAEVGKSSYYGESGAWQEGYSAPATPKLPQNWESATCDNGMVYYYNRLTGKSQWNFPEERVSSIEGVNQCQLDGLVEKAIMDAERKRHDSASSSSPSSKPGRSPQCVTPSASRSTSFDLMTGDAGSSAASSEDVKLKKEISKIVTKYLSAKHKLLWKGDKHLFKDLARKITHHIFDRETSAGKKMRTMSANLRIKIEKFIDSHGVSFVQKLERERKKRPTTSTEDAQDPKQSESRATSVSLDTAKDESEPAWKPADTITPRSTVSSPAPVASHLAALSIRHNVPRDDNHYDYSRSSRDSSSPYGRSYRDSERYAPDYSRTSSFYRSSYSNHDSYYRRSPSPSSYRSNDRYYSSGNTYRSSPYYRSSTNSSRRGSPDMDRDRDRYNRWD
ncbi:uncharacterized protein BYT42DRAFT_357888 [Radiomyces spectabilis]|uniref:uncharacterized protein n=1 Tax=Radiomyces spectabilis TaxID=64574 RepID=UPI00221F757D|nr:uncharacterized protein BYT42DRAFT_357888 [Radiomyces spectabilis]KAI8377796.1 hypothetical protein BYT42DRAFT_357888 [Radiomyces spectabilis]